MRFSIIIPVYNTEKYLERCLHSIENQTYKDFEAIIINDGSPDNSQSIINKYVNRNPKQFHSYIQKNSGLSEARNRGVELARGDYIFFLDSDDYVDSNILEVTNKYIEKQKNVDLYRISSKVFDEEGKLIKKYIIDESFNTNGEEAFIKIRKARVILEWAIMYIIRRQYWQENKFKFAKGLLHEDWGLIPLVIIKAKNVSNIADETYYCYEQRAGSIMRTNDYENKVRKAYDVLHQYDFLVNEIDKINVKNSKAKKMYLSYITDGIMGKLGTLQGKEYKEYLEKLKERKVINNAKIYSIKSFLKKILYIFILYIKR